jgi:hypothetical protein
MSGRGCDEYREATQKVRCVRDGKRQGEAAGRLWRDSPLPQVQLVEESRPMRTFYFRVDDGNPETAIVSVEAENSIDARRLLEPHYRPYYLKFYLAFPARATYTSRIMKEVITYQSPCGRNIAICQPHIDALRAADCWPRDFYGQEYCTVSHGVHRGTCDYC